MQNNTASSTIPVLATPTADERTRRAVLKTITKRSFCTLATSSAAKNGHSAGVVYAHADGALWVHTMQSSRKARNIAVHDHVGVCIPFRRMPMGPPFTINFQAVAEIVAMDDPSVTTLLADGQLKGITGHGELDMPDGCFVRITPRGKIHSFGPGARMIDLIRDPLNSGARSFRYEGVGQ